MTSGDDDSAPAGATRALLWRVNVPAALRDVRHTVVRSDIALAWAAIVVAVYVVLLLLPDATMDRVLAETSTNLENLRARPVAVLVESAFIISSPGELVLVALLLVALAYAQRFFGRVAALVVAAAGHVGATLVVAVALTTGIFHGFVSPEVATVNDVGVSYVLAGLAAFLVLVVPRPWTWWYLAVTWGWFAVPGAITRTFTDAGHLIALAIGTALAAVAWRAVRAERAGSLARRIGIGRATP